MSDKLIFHMDVNSAFLSWEAVYQLSINPTSIDLRTIPSAVAGDRETRHGIILAKSTAAKKYQILTGESISSALQKCPNLLLVSSHMNIYKEYSKKFIRLLSEYVPAIEQYSIDEVFCDMTGTEKLYGSPIETAHFLKNKVHDTLGFTVNVGISTNRLLAKMAGDFEKPDKVHTLFPDEIKEKMWPLPVSDLFSVGKATSSRLNKLGIYTIGHLASADISMLISQFGFSQREMLHNYALGIASDEVCTKEREFKGYGNSVTLPNDITTYDDAHTVLLSLCESVAMRLRKDKKKASKITVFYTTNNFIKKSHQQSLNSSTDVTLEIFQMACNLFKEFWNESTPLRLIGVQVSQVSEEIGYQYQLFENSPENILAPDRHEKLVKLDQAIDTIRNRFGSDAIIRTSLVKK